MAQALQQVLANAIDASSSGGRITLRTGSDVAGTVVLTISDEGEGMTKDVRLRATEPFFTTKARGTGLGLTIAQRLIRAHDGKLIIDSAPGRGTTVRLCFVAFD
ncbi:ATP-binding protein [Thauera mechernichensis]